MYQIFFEDTLEAVGFGSTIEMKPAGPFPTFWQAYGHMVAEVGCVNPADCCYIIMTVGQRDSLRSKMVTKKS